MFSRMAATAVRVDVAVHVGTLESSVVDEDTAFMVMGSRKTGSSCCTGVYWPSEGRVAFNEDLQFESTVYLKKASFLRKNFDLQVIFNTSDEDGPGKVFGQVTIDMSQPFKLTTLPIKGSSDPRASITVALSLAISDPANASPAALAAAASTNVDLPDESHAVATDQRREPQQTHQPKPIAERNSGSSIDVPKEQPNSEPAEAIVACAPRRPSRSLLGAVTGSVRYAAASLSPRSKGRRHTVHAIESSEAASMPSAALPQLESPSASALVSRADPATKGWKKSDWAAVAAAAHVTEVIITSPTGSFPLAQQLALLCAVQLRLGAARPSPQQQSVTVAPFARLAQRRCLAATSASQSSTTAGAAPTSATSSPTAASRSHSEHGASANSEVPESMVENLMAAALQYATNLSAAAVKAAARASLNWRAESVVFHVALGKGALGVGIFAHPVLECAVVTRSTGQAYDGGLRVGDELWAVNGHVLAEMKSKFGDAASQSGNELDPALASSASPSSSASSLGTRFKEAVAAHSHDQAGPLLVAARRWTVSEGPAAAAAAAALEEASEDEVEEAEQRGLWAERWSVAPGEGPATPEGSPPPSNSAHRYPTVSFAEDTLRPKMGSASGVSGGTDNDDDEEHKRDSDSEEESSDYPGLQLNENTRRHSPSFSDEGFVSAEEDGYPSPRRSVSPRHSAVGALDRSTLSAEAGTTVLGAGTTVVGAEPLGSIRENQPPSPPPTDNAARHRSVPPPTSTSSSSSSAAKRLIGANLPTGANAQGPQPTPTQPAVEFDLVLKEWALLELARDEACERLRVALADRLAIDEERVAITSLVAGSVVAQIQVATPSGGCPEAQRVAALVQGALEGGAAGRPLLEAKAWGAVTVVERSLCLAGLDEATEATLLGVVTSPASAGSRLAPTPPQSPQQQDDDEEEEMSPPRQPFSPLMPPPSPMAALLRDDREEWEKQPPRQRSSGGGRSSLGSPVTPPPNSRRGSILPPRPSAPPPPKAEPIQRRPTRRGSLPNGAPLPPKVPTMGAMTPAPVAAVSLPPKPAQVPVGKPSRPLRRGSLPNGAPLPPKPAPMPPADASFSSPSAAPKLFVSPTSLTRRRSASPAPRPGTTASDISATTSATTQHTAPPAVNATAPNRADFGEEQGSPPVTVLTVNSEPLSPLAILAVDGFRRGRRAADFARNWQVGDGDVLDVFDVGDTGGSLQEDGDRNGGGSSDEKSEEETNWNGDVVIASEASRATEMAMARPLTPPEMPTLEPTAADMNGGPDEKPSEEEEEVKEVDRREANVQSHTDGGLGAKADAIAHAQQQQHSQESAAMTRDELLRAVQLEVQAAVRAAVANLAAAVPPSANTAANASSASASIEPTESTAASFSHSNAERNLSATPRAPPPTPSGELLPGSTTAARDAWTESGESKSKNAAAAAVAVAGAFASAESMPHNSSLRAKSKGGGALDAVVHSAVMKWLLETGSSPEAAAQAAHAAAIASAQAAQNACNPTLLNAAPLSQLSLRSASAGSDDAPENADVLAPLAASSSSLNHDSFVGAGKEEAEEDEAAASHHLHEVGPPWSPLSTQGPLSPSLLDSPQSVGEEEAGNPPFDSAAVAAHALAAAHAATLAHAALAAANAAPAPSAGPTTTTSYDGGVKRVVGDVGAASVPGVTGGAGYHFQGLNGGQPMRGVGMSAAGAAGATVTSQESQRSLLATPPPAENNDGIVPCEAASSQMATYASAEKAVDPSTGGRSGDRRSETTNSAPEQEGDRGDAVSASVAAAAARRNGAFALETSMEDHHDSLWYATDGSSSAMDAPAAASATSGNGGNDGEGEGEDENGSVPMATTSSSATATLNSRSTLGMGTLGRGGSSTAAIGYSGGGGGGGFFVAPVTAVPKEKQRRSPLETQEGEGNLASPTAFDSVAAHEVKQAPMSAPANTGRRSRGLLDEDEDNDGEPGNQQGVNSSASGDGGGSDRNEQKEKEAELPHRNAEPPPSVEAERKQDSSAAAADEEEGRGGGESWVDLGELATVPNGHELLNLTGKKLVFDARGSDYAAQRAAMAASDVATAGSARGQAVKSPEVPKSHANKGGAPAAGTKPLPARPAPIMPSRGGFGPRSPHAATGAAATGGGTAGKEPLKSPTRAERARAAANARWTAAHPNINTATQQDLHASHATAKHSGGGMFLPPPGRGDYAADGAEAAAREALAALGHAPPNMVSAFSPPPPARDDPPPQPQFQPPVAPPLSIPGMQPPSSSFNHHLPQPMPGAAAAAATGAGSASAQHLYSPNHEELQRYQPGHHHNSRRTNGSGGGVPPAWPQLHVVVPDHRAPYAGHHGSAAMQSSRTNSGPNAHGGASSRDNHNHVDDVSTSPSSTEAEASWAVSEGVRAAEGALEAVQRAMADAMKQAGPQQTAGATAAASPPSSGGDGPHHSNHQFWVEEEQAARRALAEQAAMHQAWLKSPGARARQPQPQTQAQPQAQQPQAQAGQSQQLQQQQVPAASGPPLPSKPSQKQAQAPSKKTSKSPKKKPPPPPPLPPPLPPVTINWDLPFDPATLATMDPTDAFTTTFEALRGCVMQFKYATPQELTVMARDLEKCANHPSSGGGANRRSTGSVQQGISTSSGSNQKPNAYAARMREFKEGFLKVQQAVVMVCPGKSGAAHAKPWKLSEGAARKAADFHKQQILNGLRKMVIAFDQAPQEQRHAAFLNMPGISANLGKFVLLGAVVGAWAAARHENLQRQRMVVPGISHRLDASAWDAAAVPKQLGRIYPPTAHAPLTVKPPQQQQLQQQQQQLQQQQQPSSNPTPESPPPSSLGTPSKNIAKPNNDHAATGGVAPSSASPESLSPSLESALSGVLDSPTFGGEEMGQLLYADDSMRSIDTNATSPFQFGGGGGGSERDGFVAGGGRSSHSGGSRGSHGGQRKLPSAVRPPIPSAVSPDLAESMRRQAVSMQSLAEEQALEQNAFEAAQRAAQQELAYLRARNADYSDRYSNSNSSVMSSHSSHYSTTSGVQYPPIRHSNQVAATHMRQPLGLSGKREKAPTTQKAGARAWR